ncbi:MAG TPA: hypothetical protein GXX40_08540 [Firmicutes bacterium]|nr:hypothetical protein [Bacillota bacterium]
MARHKGEFLARSWLDITIASTNYVDNARPQFLINPSTGEPLEYDRYYPSPANVAFEFNGLQHYGPTDKYYSEEDFRSTRIRDLIKRALSDENGVTLVVLTYKDLSLNRIMSSIPDMLEKTWVDNEGPLVQTLERLSTQYRTKVEKVEKAETQRAKAGRTK